MKYLTLIIILITAGCVPPEFYYRERAQPEKPVVYQVPEQKKQESDSAAKVINIYCGCKDEKVKGKE